MKYGFSVATADIPVANKPELGGESRVKLSYEEFAIVAEITQAAPNSGTYSPSVPAFNFGGNAGRDLAVRTATAIVSAVDVVIAFGVTFDDGTTGTAEARFRKPAWAKNQSANLPIGLAVDINGTGGNSAKRIRSIDSMTNPVGGAANNVFEVIALPDIWHPIGCAKSKNFTPGGVPQPKAVACGLDASAFVVAGMSQVGSIELESLHFTYGDGINQFNGHRGSIMIERYAGGRVLCERLIGGGFRAAPRTNRGDGDDEVRDVTTALIEDFAVFV